MDVYSFVWVFALFCFSDGLNIGLKNTNVAVNKTATQFETYNDGVFTWDPSYAVDGCTNVNAEVSKCCSATNNPTDGTLNYWQVNLNDTYNVGLIVIYGRTDTAVAGAQMNGFTVYAQTAEGPGTSADLVYTDPGTNYPVDGRFEMSIEPARELSMIRIERSGFLVICEVEAYEVCDNGTYGNDCLEQCGWCGNNETCNRINGQCPSVCESGWSSPMCDSCVDGKYGANCMNDCGACFNNSICDNVNGSCGNDGCDPGYIGDNCAEECSGGTYGYDCNMTCGNCINGAQCNIMTGSCVSCAAGYSGTMCDQECVSPSYGPGCNQVCECTTDEACNPVTGSCPGSGASGLHKIFNQHVHIVVISFIAIQLIVNRQKF